MSKGRAGSGVSEAAGKIQVSFQYLGKRCRETIDLECSLTNLRATERTLKQIREKIKDGTFDYAAEFPNSLKVKRGVVPRVSGSGGRLLSEMLDAWLKTKTRLADNTKKNYKNAAEVWKTIFHDKSMKDMLPEYVETVVAEYPFASAKLLCDYLIVLRGACKLAAKGDKTWVNPMNGIENPPKEDPQPDPLSRQEMKKLLAYVKKSFDIRIYAWFIWQFETGMRPEEAIALRWGDVDWQDKKCAVRRARTLSKIRPVKTYENRHVDMSIPAIEALTIMKNHPLTSVVATNEIFQNPNINDRFNDNRSQHDLWTKAMEACHIEKRRSYNTRHTYATLRLVLGAVPLYISRQMGHKNPQMLFRIYSKWIDSDRTERERVEKMMEMAAKNLS